MVSVRGQVQHPSPFGGCCTTTTTNTNSKTNFGKEALFPKFVLVLVGVSWCPFPDKSSTPPHLEAVEYKTSPPTTSPMSLPRQGKHPPLPSTQGPPCQSTASLDKTACVSYGMGQDYLGEWGDHGHPFSPFMVERGEGCMERVWWRQWPHPGGDGHPASSGEEWLM